MMILSKHILQGMFSNCFCTKGEYHKFVNHLKRNHRHQYEMVRKNKAAQSQSRPTCSQTKQTSIQATLFNATPYPTTSPKHKEITDAIAFHLAKDMAPVATVAKDGFKKLIQTLDKRYCVPSRIIFHTCNPCSVTTMSRNS